MFILCILTMLCIGLIVMGITSDEENVIGIGIVFFVGILVLGWGVIGCSLVTKIDSKLINIESIVRTKTSVIIEYNGIRQIYEDVAHYNAISDSSIFELETGYNMYGGIVDKNIVLKKEVND